MVERESRSNRFWSCKNVPMSDPLFVGSHTNQLGGPMTNDRTWIHATDTVLVNKHRSHIGLRDDVNQVNSRLLSIIGYIELSTREQPKPDAESTFTQKHEQIGSQSKVTRATSSLLRLTTTSLSCIAWSLLQTSPSYTPRTSLGLIVPRTGLRIVAARQEQVHRLVIRAQVRVKSQRFLYLSQAAFDKEQHKGSTTTGRPFSESRYKRRASRQRQGISCLGSAGSTGPQEKERGEYVDKDKAPLVRE